MLYVFKYRKYNRWFCKKIKVSGHAYLQEQDKMIIYYPDGTISEIAHWKDYEVFLGLDWKESVRKQKSIEAGTSIELEL